MKKTMKRGDANRMALPCISIYPPASFTHFFRNALNLTKAMTLFTKKKNENTTSPKIAALRPVAPEGRAAATPRKQDIATETTNNSLNDKAYSMRIPFPEVHTSTLPLQMLKSRFHLDTQRNTPPSNSIRFSWIVAEEARASFSPW